MPRVPTVLRPRYSLRAAVLGALCLPFIAGCGAEVAGTAATVGKLQADQASQAKAQQAQIVDGLQKAQQAGVQRAADAAASAGQ